MASVCYAYGLTPAEYRALTVAEHRAFVSVLRDAQKGGK